MENSIHHEPWNRGKLVGQKPPLELKEIWAIRIRLQLASKTRDLAMFNLAIDNKLRGCVLPQWLQAVGMQWQVLLRRPGDV
jgi:hypothetical protein